MKCINLLPVQWIDQRTRRASRRTAVALICAFVPVLLIGVGVCLFRLSSIETRINHERQRVADLSAQIAGIEKLAAEKAAITRQLRERQAVVPALPITRAISLVITCMPKDMGLTRLLLESPMPTVTESADKAVVSHSSTPTRPAPSLGAREPLKLQLQGYASNDMVVADFVDQLGRRPLLQDVKLAMSREVQLKNVPLHEFYLTMTAPMDRTFIVGETR